MTGDYLTYAICGILAIALLVITDISNNLSFFVHGISGPSFTGRIAHDGCIVSGYVQ